MKFISALVLSLTTFVGLSASVSVQLDRRSDVNCQGMYRGSLYASDLSDLHPNGYTTSNQNKETWRGFAVVTDSNDYLVLGDEPLTWQFDACQTDGWNNDFQDLGQLKLISSGFYNAVTADKNVTEFSNEGHALRIRPAFDANYGRLDRQWFRAYWTEDSQGEPYVALTLSGNPNDINDEYALPKIGFSGGDVDNKVLAEPNWSTVSFTLALFDLEYL